VPDLISLCRLLFSAAGYRRKYPTGREVSDAEMQRVNLERNKFHGEWNYIIKPNADST